MTVEQMRTECVRHYVERRHTPDHAELIVPREESEIRRIYAYIQEGKKQGYTQGAQPFPNLTDEETTAE